MRWHVSTPSPPYPLWQRMLMLDHNLISQQTARLWMGLDEGATDLAGPKNARTRDDGFRYYDWRGQPLISVTSIRQVLGSPIGLTMWAQGQIVDKAVDNIDELVQRAGVDPVDAKKWLRRAATEARDAAGQRGTAVHEMAESGIPSTHPDVDPVLRPWLEQYEEALASEGIAPLLRECQVFSTTLGYAGSFDLIATRQGEVTLIDLKTSKGTYIDHALQLMGYAVADFVGKDDVIDEDATKVLNRVSAMGILHVQETSWEYVPIPKPSFPALKAAWVAEATLAKFLQQTPDIPALSKYV